MEHLCLFHLMLCYYIFPWHTLIKVSGTVQNKVQLQYSIVCGSLNAINGRKRQLRHPVAKEGSVAPLEENSEAGPDVRNSLPLHLAAECLGENKSSRLLSGGGLRPVGT